MAFNQALYFKILDVEIAQIRFLAPDGHTYFQGASKQRRLRHSLALRVMGS
jgi:hypothetical protein